MASHEESYPIIRTPDSFTSTAAAAPTTAPSTSARRFRSRFAAVIFIFTLLSGVAVLIPSNSHVFSPTRPSFLMRTPSVEESVPMILEAQIPTFDCSGGLYCRLSVLVTTIGTKRKIETGYIIFIPRESTLINDVTKKNVAGATDIEFKKWSNDALTQIARTYPLSKLGISVADIVPAAKLSREVLLTCTSTAQEACTHRVMVKSYPEDGNLVVEAFVKTNDCAWNAKLECQMRLLVTITKTTQTVEAGYIVSSKKKGNVEDVDENTIKQVGKATDLEMKTWSKSAIVDISKRIDFSMFGLSDVDIFPAVKESRDKLLTCEKTSDTACTTMVVIKEGIIGSTTSPTQSASPSSSAVPTPTTTPSSTPAETPTMTPTTSPTSSPTPTATVTPSPSPSPAELCPASIEDFQCAEFYSSLPGTAPTDWASLIAMMPFCGPPDFIYNTIGIKAPLCLEAAVTNREGEKCPPLVRFDKFYMKIGSTCQRDCMASTVLEAYKKTYPVLKPCDELQNMEPFVMLYPTVSNADMDMPSTCGNIETTFFYSGQVADSAHTCDFQ